MPQIFLESSTINETSSWFRFLTTILDISPQGITQQALEQHLYLGHSDVFIITDSDHFTNELTYTAPSEGEQPRPPPTRIPGPDAQKLKLFVKWMNLSLDNRDEQTWLSISKADFYREALSPPTPFHWIDWIDLIDIVESL